MDGWQPDISNWERYASWAENGKPDIVETARERVDEILADAEKPLLDELTAKQLKRFLDSVPISDDKA